MKKFMILVMLVFPVFAWPQEAVFPRLTGPVVDTTSTLKTEQVKVLSAKSLALQKEKGAQVVICIVNTTSPLPIEDYGIKLAGKWKVGRAKVDDGVIIIVALKDRKMRIEVGYGLEPVITDLKAGRIIDLVMAPEFKRGNFYGGLNSAFDALSELIKGGEPAAFRAYDAAASRTRDSGYDLKTKAGIGLIIGAFIVFVVLMVMGRLLLSLVMTYLFHAAGLYLVGVGTMGDSALFALIPAGLYAFLGLGIKYGGEGGGSSSGSGGYSSYSSSSSSSSSSYSSSSSSSSYSGGGGSFGGGGASGGW